MQNITPEDRKKWDKAIADHARRLKRQERSTAHRIFRAICVGTVAGIIITLVVAHYLPSPETQDPEIILNDTLQMNAGDISRDSSLDEMRKTPAGREYDSVVRTQEKIDSASVGPWTMDSIASYLQKMNRCQALDVSMRTLGDLYVDGRATRKEWKGACRVYSNYWHKVYEPAFLRLQAHYH